MFPPVIPINHETLKALKDDDRKIVLTIVEDDTEEKSKKTFKLLKAAASANRDLIFGYVGVKQWDDFADTFGANKKTKLPKMLIWDGDVEYFSVSSFFFFFFLQNNYINFYANFSTANYLLFYYHGCEMYNMS